MGLEMTTTAVNIKKLGVVSGICLWTDFFPRHKTCGWDQNRGQVYRSMWFDPRVMIKGYWNYGVKGFRGLFPQNMVEYPVSLIFSM